MIFNLLFGKKSYRRVDVQKLKDALDYLKTNPKVECDSYPSYDGRIYEVLGSLGMDENYMSNYEKMKDVPVEQMTLDNLKTMYSFITRAERFCDGAIAGYVEDGSLAKMAEREIELLGEGKR